jgi:serine protease DegQ
VELYSINGKILIEGVIRDSPADRAGVKEGDIVLAVNDHEVQDLRSVKNSIQNSPNKLRLRLQRNGQNIEIRFKVLSMFR